MAPAILNFIINTKAFQLDVNYALNNIHVLHSEQV